MATGLHWQECPDCDGLGGRECSCPVVPCKHPNCFIYCNTCGGTGRVPKDSKVLPIDILD